MCHLFSFIFGKEKAVSVRETSLFTGFLQALWAFITCLRPACPCALQKTRPHRLFSPHSLRHEHSERMEMVGRVVSFQMNTKINQSSTKWKTPNYHNSRAGRNKNTVNRSPFCFTLNTWPFFYSYILGGDLCKLNLWISFGAPYKTKQSTCIYIVFTGSRETRYEYTKVLNYLTDHI